MLRLLYSCLFYLAIPFVLIRLLKRSLKEPEYRSDLLQRFGFFKTSQSGDLIWVHAVSAGETIAAVPLVQRLRRAGFSCLLTNMTPTGRDRVRVLLGDDVENCYAPYDLPGAINRFLKRNQPCMLITIDTELWPNMLAACRHQNVKTAVVNGRMSDRSSAGYARIAGLSRPMLERLDLVLVQTEQHAQRFANLGADKNNIHVTGSIKFDGQYSANHSDRLLKAKRLVGSRPVLLGASTHEGEESALVSIMPALLNVLPEALLILAPRHTHRSDSVFSYCASAGCAALRLSEQGDAPVSDTSHVLLIDSMGELESYFPIARLAFVGGSLVPNGGHNLLEAIRAGTAVVMGPHLFNVEDITGQFVDANGMVVVSNQLELQDEVVGYMRDEGKLRHMVEAANLVLADNRGSLDRVEQHLLLHLKS